MKIEVRNRIVVALLVFVVFWVLTFALTQARYSQEKSPDNHTGELNYTIANQIEVATTEQFFAAIENGYSNIKIADAVSNPFLVSGSADVESDLILDLNGHQIQRNSREPMLTIKEGVKMIVTDTSKSQKGSFYNPVGSVLKIDGGVLTVMSNKFESGPRDDEYYSNRDKNFENTNGVLQYIGGTITKAKESMSVSTKSGKQYTASDKENVPIVLPYTTEAEQGAPIIDGKKYFVNGNIYFNDYDSFETDVASYNSELIKKDTYLYFTIDDQNASSSTIVASTEGADFHYCYYVRRNGTKYEYAGKTQTDAAKDIKVTIYGYHNVIASAKNEVEPYIEKASNFAAIKMLRGSMYARGGEFSSYFGVPTSSCIYADEGALSVYGGTYTAIEEGVAVKCNYYQPESEFTIVGGSLKSFKGDTIYMSDGEMTITGGTFVKDSSSYKEGNAGSNNNNSAIKLDDGVINLKSAEDTPIHFYLAGRYMAAIECGSEAEIHSDGVNFQFGTTDGKNEIPGGNNIGILSQGGNVNVDNCTFIQPGDYSYGIYSYDDVGNNSVDVVSSIFSMGGERCTGIYANGGKINIGCEKDLYQPERNATVYNSEGKEKIHTVYNNGYEVKDENGQTVKEIAKGISINNYTMFYLDHVANCYGVFVEKKEQTAETQPVTTQINVYAGQFAVGSGYASDGTMYAEDEIPGEARLDGNGNYTAYYGAREITTKEDMQKAETVWSAGVYLNDPNATVSLGRARLIIAGSYAAGVFAENGTVNKLYNEDIDKSYNGTPMAENDLPTTVFFIGTRMLGYQNGGFLNKDATVKEEKWNHLYKRDYDYYQTKNFEAYYDRIDDCNGTDDYGIAAKAGSVSIGRAYINIRSEFSRGIFASAGSSVSEVKLDDLIANIDNKEKVGNEYMVPQSLSTTTMTIRNGHVTIKNADVRTNGVGIVINNGQLKFNGNIKFQATNASAIYMTSTAMVSGGTTAAIDNTWTIGEKAKVSIFCNIREKSSTNLTTPTPWKLKNVHNREEDENQLPIDTTNKTNEYYMLSYNGVNIKGGSFNCEGELFVDFHGVNNENQTTYDPYNIPLSSCAINVEQLQGSDAPDVNMWHAHIESGKPIADYKENDRFYNNKDDITESNGGGGVSVKGGNVSLGKINDKGELDNEFYASGIGSEVLNNTHKGNYNELITIETYGNKRYKDSWGYDYLDNPNYVDKSEKEEEKSYQNWQYAVSETGGPGIKVDSGSITVEHGTCYAAQGNGIVLTGGTATVYNGIFRGRNTEWASWENDSTGSGLGSYYGFMLRGGGNLTIYNGKFEGFNGGAFVVGSSKEKMAIANVYGGTFEDLPERRRERFTTNGFSVGPYSTVVLGKETNLPAKANDDAPKILGIACGIAVENNYSLISGMEAIAKAEALKEVYITIQGGTLVRGTGSDKRTDNKLNAIWKGNTSATLKFGECTLLLQRQNIVFNENGEVISITDGDVFAQNENYVILGEYTPWNSTLLDNTYHVYEFPNLEKVPTHTETGYEVDYTWQAQGHNAFKIVISKEKLDWGPYPSSF